MTAPVYRFIPNDLTRPPLLLLHGTGGSVKDLLPIGRFLAPRSPLLALAGRVVENGQRRFFAHHPDGSPDLTSVACERDWLVATVAALSAQYQLDLSRLIAVGYSNGANLISHTLLTRPVPWLGAVLLHGTLVTPVPQPQPLAGRAVFASFGTHDPRISAAAFTGLVATLRRAGATVNVHQHDQRHNLNGPELKAAQAWIAARGR
ncbi:alpha/beta hydrolase [Lacticaseibacillus daqingensis]|uniref:alpha/beta hydrolase n=1 Tax=Lacticaseibacillus daqingensis TaxID=2486014 RepID=UPI000F79FE67|nr:alpha/beta hydrolase [Lacticaseibacillus daqingensis]